MIRVIAYLLACLFVVAVLCVAAVVGGVVGLARGEWRRA